MRNFFRNNELFQIGSLNSMGVLVRMATGLLVNKLLAVFLLPQGLALIGNFRDFMQALRGISTFSIEKGVTKYTADYKRDAQKLSEFISSLLFATAVFTGLIGLAVIIGAGFFSQLLFDTPDYQLLFRFLGMIVPFMALHSFLVAIVNGLGRYKTVVWIGIACNVSYALVMFYALRSFELTGALFTLGLIPFVYLLITLWLVKEDWPVLLASSYQRVKRFHLNGLMIYAGMVLLSAIVFPLLYVFIRNHITESLSAADAGYWEAMHRLSRQYMMFVLSLMTLYLLPKYAESTSATGFLKWAGEFYKMVLPFFVVGLVLIYVLKSFLIRLLFSEEFLPMEPLFKWQLIGDLFRALAMVLVFQFHAKRRVWPYIITDMLLAVLLYFGVLYGVRQYGLEGSVMAHAAAYLLYFCIIVFVFRKELWTYWSEKRNT